MGLTFTWFDRLLLIGGGAIVMAICFYATQSLLDAYSPLLGRPAVYSIIVRGKPEVCARAATEIVFEGKICSVRGSNVQVLWNSIANASNSDPACEQKYMQWTRSENDQAWNQRFVGFCGVSPDYFGQLPNSFSYQDVNVLRLRR